MGESTVIAWEEVFTVGTDHAVITWETPGAPGETAVYIGRSRDDMEKLVFAHRSTRHYAEVSGLAPDARYWYQVETNGVRGPLGSFRTLPAPGGRRLFNFALFSDPHINSGIGAGDPNERYFGKLLKHARTLLLQSLAEARRRGADLAFIPGDLTDAALPEQFAEVRDDILPAFGEVPCYICPGNHDKYERQAPEGRGIGARGFREYLGETGTLYRVLHYGNCRFLLLDTAVRDANRGRLDAVQLAWLEHALRQDPGSPAFLLLHHPAGGPDLWRGLANPGALWRVIRGFPAIQGVFSGHVHRCLVTSGIPAGTPHVELPATMQFPCGYGFVRVYEKGFTYNAYKVKRLDLVAASREAVRFGTVGQALYASYAAGGVGDRNLTRTLEGRTHRPAFLEVSAVLRPREARELFARVQPYPGAAVFPAAQEGRERVVLGRYESWAEADGLRRTLASQLGLRASISPEGGCHLPFQMQMLLAGPPQP